MNAGHEILKAQAIRMNTELVEWESKVNALKQDPTHVTPGSAAYKLLGAARNNRNRIARKLEQMERDCPAIFRK